MVMLDDYKVGDGTESGTYTPLPPDDYTVLMESAEMVPTKDGTGLMLKVKFQVLEGQYKGRLIFDNWTYKNNSEVAQNIGRGKITSLSKACGYTEGQIVKDTADLCNKPVLAKVVVQTQADWPARNVVQAFKPVNAGVKPVQIAKPTTSTLVNDDEAAPWSA